MSEMQGRMKKEGFLPLSKKNSSFSQKAETREVLNGAGHFMNEQVFNASASLPEPFTQEQIEAARVDAAEYTLLHRIPRECAKIKGFAGQQLRRVMLHGASIVFFTPGYEGKRFIYERARELGVKAVIIDQYGSWAESLVDDHIITKFIGMDLHRDSEVVFRDALAQIEALSLDPLLDFRRPAGVCTFCELSVPIVARLAEALGLPGPSSAAVDTARDKHRTRGAMVAAGLPSPACFRIDTAADLGAASEAVGFPAVLKPLSGAASLGVMKVGSKDELVRCYDEVMTEMRSTIVSSGALVKTAAGAPASTQSIVFLLEEYLDGIEVDVDVVMAEGLATYAAVVDNGPTAEPYFAETWGIFPSRLPEATQVELRKLAVDALQACGFDCGVFHVELKNTTRGPRLIEINARMGGGQVRSTHLLTNGVDLVEETLFTCVGIPCAPHVERRLPAVAYNYVTAPQSGVIGDIEESIARTAAEPDVIYAKALVRPGDRICGPRDGLPTWVADIMVSKNSNQEALDYVLKLSTDLDIPLV
ncbi:ATP-grasp domain-containing protein [Pelagophyceae sp. CCMP2097]|nr:ATP-grasp domain-containing protein [Pelagophyceae sp. CCMP2097]|mmetsp:Transcript_13293/g.47175  ORF Transcript_13293/g.47175 Transcript_13293/m.47175 type:complete len:533 (-) Transcript_13293:230-1828(-)